MARIPSLSHLDPLSVPLPSGTEIVTRIDRAWGETRIPSGALGRVVRSEGDRLIVRIVGVGEGDFARPELTPRKLDQALKLHRVAEVSARLMPCVVLESVVGSRAWGLASEHSDIDRRGVFVLPHPWTTGLADPPRDLVSEDATSAFWEARKAIIQGLRADPSTLEMLFVPGVRALDEMGEWLMAARDAFVSSAIYGSFGRYALSQLARLEQSARLAEHRTHVLAWLREDPDLTLDAAASRLAKETRLDVRHASDPQARAKEWLKQLCRSLHDQGEMPDRSFTALKAFAATPRSLELPRELRPKNAYNLLRLLSVATEWLRTGEPQLETSGPLRERLLQIKRGDVELDEVIAEAQSMTPALEEARRATRLPAEPDLRAADALLRRIGHESARRWILRVPGPFGSDAPAPPEPEAPGEDAGGGSDDA